MSHRRRVPASAEVQNPDQPGHDRGLDAAYRLADARPMTTTTQLRTGSTHSDEHATTGSLVERAKALGPRLAEHAVSHDVDGTFVTEAYEALREAGLLKVAVPVELGGEGATITELAALQRELAHYCGATAL